MSDSPLTHDAADTTRTFQELKTDDSATRRNSLDAAGDEAGITVSASAGQVANLSLFARIDHALRKTGYLPLLKLHILATDEIVVLRGAVPSYYMKQIAQAAVSGVPGVTEVHNLLDVVPPER
jgi:hypothetical protein